jgi:diaminohydroxyphosphoribosylaminopyrimidine deaminase/5-amino-6-(5-phosphoribosylamino)uracil reductase
MAAGVGRVVVAVLDPNPLVAGRGVERLRAAGLAVEVLPPDHPVAIEANELNIGFMSRMIRQRPWVRMKVAASLDGITALANGQSQWITGAPARADGHAWRARACAVLTGIGTVLHDNPRLDVREATTPRQPGLVVVDSQLQTPPDALLFEADRPVWICAAGQKDAKNTQQQALQARGAEVLHLPGQPPAGTDKVDLVALMAELARREINELHVEAGYRLNGSLVRAGLVDEFLVYLAPKLVGEGLGLARLGPLSSLAQAQGLEFTTIDRIGADLRILARPPGQTGFLTIPSA